MIFGKYEIQRRLAIGGMGEVFYAVQRGVPGFERAVILKSLLPELAQQPGFIDQFLDEARVAATLNHPNLVSIFEVGLWEGTYFIAMEYIRGRNLSQVLRRSYEQGALVPPSVAARVICDAALGLMHAHGALNVAGEPLHIVHRDISPQNIMLRDDGVTKVVDFGIARASNRATRTATGLVKGKLAYLPPEQVQGEQATPSSDQYALGICLWELLTQRRLFKADTDLETLKLVLAGCETPPSNFAPAVYPALDAIVMRMLAPSPADRFGSCGEVAAALDAFLSSHTEGQESAEAFMRRLGTEDLELRTPSQPNFVIPLAAAEPQRPKPAAEGTAVVAMPAPPPPARSWLPLALGVTALAVALGVVAAQWSTPTPAASLPPAPLPAVAAAPDASSPVVMDAAPAAPARLSVVTVPAGANVRLDGRLVGTAPLELDVTPDVLHYIALEKSGYRKVEQDVPRIAAGGQAEVKVSLVQFATPAAPLTARPTGAPEPAGPAANGYLSLDTQPWSQVTVDGVPAGSTPLYKWPLAAGKHALLLVNEGASVRVNKSITVASGETVKLSLSLK